MNVHAAPGDITVHGLSVPSNGHRKRARGALQADLEEGRNVFEEGNAFTMEAVQQQLDDLAAKHEAQVSVCLAKVRSGLCCATAADALSW